MTRFLLKLLKLALIIGVLALVLTPVVREQSRVRQMAGTVAAYRRAVEALEPSERQAMLAQARAAGSEEAALADASGEGAEGALPDPCGNGLLAVLEIPRLGATLPVWRSDVQEAGARHVSGSGLTVGGASARCMMIAEVAELGRLSPGDQLILWVLGERTTCEVVRITAFDSGGMDWPESGGEWCALVAHDPVSLRGDWFLVTARHVPPAELRARDDTRMANGLTSLLSFAAPVVAIGLIALALIEGLRQCVRRAKIKRMRL